ncbi:MAG: TRAP transporter small permease [Proteobacteria bacterium]|nr:TRAP transporter small permease [Pseudomonadota bacterium]
MPALLKTLNHHLQQLEIWLASGALLLLLSLSIFQILLRNILEFGYPEIDIINRHLLVVCGMMGAALATAKSTHIKTDALNILLSTATKQKLQLPINLFAAFVCGLLCYYSFIFVSDEWQYAPPNERWTLPFTVIYPLSFCLMAVHFFYNAISPAAGLSEPSS